MHKYTEEEKQFLKEFVSGHSHKEICEAFNKKFNCNIPISTINGYISNHKLNTGRTGRFEKGTIPHNKGAEGVHYPGCEKTWFKKGEIPANHRIIGSERITKDGYIEIKVAEPNKWKLKHRFVWEQNFRVIPKGHAILFKDQNKLNIDIENLMLISRKELAILNKNNLIFSDPELTSTGVNIAKLMVKVTEVKK